MSDISDLPVPNTAQHLSATLHIDLVAMRANYRKFADFAAPADCSAAVKANGYGLGIDRVARALWAEGCRVFFVALLAEADELRTILPEATIYVLNGLPPGSCDQFTGNKLRPVLCSLDEVSEWSNHSAAEGRKHPAALHIESGINRLGLTANDVLHLSDRSDLLEAFKLTLVLSHLASGDEPANPSNKAQIQIFNKLRAKLPAAPASLANSPGALLGREFAFDLVRPGIGLYGGRPGSEGANQMKPVVHLTAKISQVRTVQAGEKVGYSGSWIAERDSQIAVIPVGYADGYRRSLSSDPEKPHARIWINGHYAPVVGRVSMDMITVDVTDLPAEVAKRGADVELIGAHVTIDELAERAGTIAYEIFTGLGSRFARVYSSDESL